MGSCDKSVQEVTSTQVLILQNEHFNL